jgi:tetratricopeptide (TPR) repeat protein
MSGSKYRGRRKGVSIREGSVLRARQEAGLSLAQVAAGAVSRTAIHYIETGRTRPSMETLRQIARRTGRPLAYFLDGDHEPAAVAHGELDQLEDLTARRQFGEVVSLASKALRKKWDRVTVGLMHFYLGQAYCRLVKPTDALPHLHLARESFEGERDERMLVEALDWLSSALGLLEDPGAIDLAYDALVRCRELSPRAPQTEARILGHIAGMHVVNQSWSQAVRYYEAAASAAGEVKDLLQLAKMHHGLGTVHQRMSQPAAARHHFDLALALYSLENDSGALFRVHNDLGFLLLRERQFNMAEQHLNKALAGCDEVEMSRRGRGFVLVSLGELKFRTGRPAEARAHLLEAFEAATGTEEEIVAADAHQVLGQLEEQEGNRGAADLEFHAAIATLEGLRMPDRLRQCHMLYAELLDGRGDLSGAAREWKAAAEVAQLTNAGRQLVSELEATAASA